MRNVSVLTCPEWYMLWTIPGYQPLPSLNYHHHQQKNDPNSKSNFNKKKWMMRQWQPKIIIMPMGGVSTHTPTIHKQKAERKDGASGHAHTVHWHTHAEIIGRQERRRGVGGWNNRIKIHTTQACIKQTEGKQNGGAGGDKTLKTKG